MQDRHGRTDDWIDDFTPITDSKLWQDIVDARGGKYSLRLLDVFRPTGGETHIWIDGFGYPISEEEE